ncbi:hypothetical protein ACI7RC_20225 [Brevibacillus sp. B_LB10_24]|uniref:hypothetical protein n=1 Tax=Brevibacillus sp. B_LB10_24 TaxID=3380645 RepID=UPI0038B6C741
MPLFYPVFLILIGLLVMLQPKTKRWQRRISAHVGGDQRRVKSRANTFFLLGFCFVLTGFALLYRATTQ